MNETTRARIVTGMLSGAYLMLLVETWLDHQDEFGDHWPAYFGPVTGLIGLVILAIAAANWQPLWRKLGQCVGGWSILVGLLGFILHNEDRFEEGFDFAPPMIPPLLAPLAFAGLGVFTVLLLWPTRQVAAVENAEPTKAPPE